MVKRLEGIVRSGYWTAFKWAVMTAAIFWMIVFRLSEEGAKIPEFIYVNF